MTKIEWTDKTWNLITGCTKHSEGCQNCYAEKMHKRLTAMGQDKYKKSFNEVVFHDAELYKTFGNTRKMIFVNSMSDTFHSSIEDGNIKKILLQIEFNDNNYKHIFQILTKRAERLPNFEYPENVWLGVTVEMAKYKGRMEYLKQTNAKVKFLSCEPLLEDLGELNLKGIDWVICGGESGRNARPMHPNWVRNIQKQCKEQNVPFFFKQWGEWVPQGEVIPPYKGDLPRIRKSEFLNFDGTFAEATEFSKNQRLVYKIGKLKAGAYLGGREFKNYPRLDNKKEK